MGCGSLKASSAISDRRWLSVTHFTATEDCPELVLHRPSWAIRSSRQGNSDRSTPFSHALLIYARTLQKDTGCDCDCCCYCYCCGVSSQRTTGLTGPAGSESRESVSSVTTIHGSWILYSVFEILMGTAISWPLSATARTGCLCSWVSLGSPLMSSLWQARGYCIDLYANKMCVYLLSIKTLV